MMLTTQCRGKLLMKLGCWLVIFSLVLGLILPQQKAEALVAELSMTAVASVAAAYLGACGLPFITKGMDKDALVSSVQRLIQEFLDTELGGISIQDWLGNVWDLAVIAGKLIMGRPLTEEFVSFAQWVAGKYAAQAGENVVYSNQGITFSDGSFYTLTYYLGVNSGNDHDYFSRHDYVLGNTIPYGESTSDFYEIRVTSTYLFHFYKGTEFYCYRSVVDGVSGPWRRSFDSVIGPVTFIAKPSTGAIYLGGVYPDNSYHVNFTTGVVIPADIALELLSFSDLSIGREDEIPVYIPPGIATEQGIALDVGAAATMDLDQVLQGVLDGVLEGTLTSTMEIAQEVVVDPPAGEITDVDNLGLPALGQALTSRFPFSIPWDFFRAVQLLAAPAKAPRFKVDFMQPIEHRVGEWQGDTTIVLDFAEYAIIGQISRWTSTIGFCLMLAGATKRLIWTA